MFLEMDSDIKLYHNMINNELGHIGFLDDYAYLLQCYLTAYSVTFDSQYLEKADRLAELTIEQFWKDENEGFMQSNINSDSLINQKKYIDSAYASGYSVMIQSLEKLGKITANPKYHDHASRAAQSIADFVNHSPFISLKTVDYINNQSNDSFEIVVVEGEDDASLYLQVIEEAQIRNVTIIFKNHLNAEHLSTYVPYTESYSAIKGNTTVYICQNATCKLPISDINQLYDMLSSLK